MSYAIKPFVVIKKIDDCSASVVREFDDLEPAAVFASLLKTSEEKDFINYYVAEVRMPNDAVSSPSCAV